MPSIAKVCFALGLLASLGCGWRSSSSFEKSEKPLRELGQLYGHFLARNGRPPVNQEEFDDFLNANRVKNMAERLVSPRDGESLVLLFGDQIGQSGPDGFPWIAHEKMGVDGNRLVISARGGVESMNAAQFQEAFPEQSTSISE